MACLEHTCRTCGHDWFNNDPAKMCPNCGSTDTVVSWDETEDDHDPDPEDQYYERDPYS